jgi:hypothetical protein
MGSSWPRSRDTVPLRRKQNFAKLFRYGEISHSEFHVADVVPISIQEIGRVISFDCLCCKLS